MTLLQIIPLAAYGLIIIAAIMAITGKASMSWRLPAGLSVIFAVFSVYTIYAEGLLGFWPNHSNDFWGNQVWIDLLLATFTAFVLLLPRAKSHKIAILPWAIFTLTTASIGLLAFYARVLFVESKQT